MSARLILAPLILTLAFCGAAAAQTLSWDPNTEPDLAGYRVYSGTASRSYGPPVDVGNTTSYPVKVLTAGTYFFAVTAYNTSGLESEFSEELSGYLGPDASPPAITALPARIITQSGVTISWATDEPATVAVVWGTSAEHGDSLPAGSATGLQSVRLNGLAPATTYHYRIVATDEAGNQSTTDDATFTTAPAPESIAASRVTGYPRLPASVPYMGIGLTNAGDTVSAVRLTAFNSGGVPVVGQDLTNPVALVLGPGEQVVALDAQIFGDGIGASAAAWIRVESATDEMTGLFFGLNHDLTKMDGGTLPRPGLMESSVRGRLSISNPHAEPCTVMLALRDAQGSLRGTAQRVVPPNGTFSAELAGLFREAEVHGSDYVRISATQEVFCFETVIDTPDALALLAGSDVRGFSPALYAPDFIAGGGWHSSISLVNLEALPGTVTVRLFAADGTPRSEAAVYLVPGYGGISISGTDLLSADPDSMVRGYVEVSTNVALSGSLTSGFGSQAASTFPLASTLGRRLLLGQVVSDSQYYTGIALLNPGAETAAVTLELHLPDGTLAATWGGTLKPRQRLLQLATQFFPELADKEIAAGYVRVIADKDIAALALFGTNALSATSAVPAQAAP